MISASRRAPTTATALQRQLLHTTARALFAIISSSASASAAAAVSSAALAPDEGHRHHHPHVLRHHAEGNERQEKGKRKEQQVLAREFAKPQADVTFLVNNYTAPALAAAYQDREYTLRLCAELLSEGKLDELKTVLTPYHDFSLQERSAKRLTDLRDAFGARHLERIRKRLSRLPRQITKAYTQRAAVVIPLCTFNGEPSVLFTLRSLTVGKHKGEVCFPGGMVDEADSCIEATCLREMEEEVGLHADVVDVLGVLRCDWSNVTSITGIAVTPVVGFVGEMRDQNVVINENEVEQLFTVSLRDLMDPENWIRRPNATPVFTGGPHVVWGLTAYLLDICLSEVLLIAQEGAGAME